MREADLEGAGEKSPQTIKPSRLRNIIIKSFFPTEALCYSVKSYINFLG